MARAGVLEQYVEHGKQAQRSPGGRIACFDRRVVRKAGYRLHPLKGNRRGQWSVYVSGNWRMVFRFVDGEAVDVDLIDYH